MRVYVLFALLLAVRTAHAECPSSTVDCGDGTCCGSATPVCCPFVCCGSNGRCSSDGFSCVPIDEEEGPDEPEVPTLPECDDGSFVALNRCGVPGGPTDAGVDDACGCTKACAGPADCATGCCYQGQCALACVCAGGPGVAVVQSPTPEQCSMAGGTAVEPANAPPIGGFGGPGCATSSGATAIPLFALVGLLIRRRRTRR